MSVPLVSIICCAYNHEPYIRQCLDGFIMQETNFPFEVLIHDDASTDRTADIIREYETKYPEIIKPIYQTENQYQKKIDVLSTFLFPGVKGKYIAMCEGDDYWTDPLKLQKQVDFLENNQEYVLCTHYYTQFFQENLAFGATLPLELTGGVSFSLQDYITYRYWYTQPLTSVFRADLINRIISKHYNDFKDASLFFAILSYGKGYLYPDAMGVYRIQKGGVWSRASRQERIAADLRTMKGLYEVEKSMVAAMYIYNFMERTGYFGLAFFRKNLKLYIDVVVIIIKMYGFRSIRVISRSLNFLAR